MSKFGYFLPLIVASGAVMAIGDGLYSMLGPATSQATWIGYQIVSGVGNGLGSTIVSMLHSINLLSIFN